MSMDVEMPVCRVYAAARRARLAIYKARLQELRRVAKNNCDPCWLVDLFRKYFSHRPAPVTSERDIRQEMRSIVKQSRNGPNLHDFDVDKWRFLYANQLDRISSLIWACRVSCKRGMIRLSESHVRALNGFL